MHQKDAPHPQFPQDFRLPLIVGDIVVVVQECFSGVKHDAVGAAAAEIGPQLSGKSRNWLLSLEWRTGPRRPFSIGVCLNDIGTSPIVVPREERLYLGAESIVGCFDVRARACCWRCDIDAVIHDLIPVGADLLVVGEHCIERLHSDGSRAWRNDTDLISNYEFRDDGALVVEFVDDAAVVIDTVGGRCDTA